MVLALYMRPIRLILRLQNRFNTKGVQVIHDRHCTAQKTCADWHYARIIISRFFGIRMYLSIGELILT